MTKIAFLSIALAFSLWLPLSSLAAEETAPSPTPTGSSETTFPPAESLGEIQLGPNGQTTLTPEVINQLNQALAEKSQPQENKWDPYIRIGIDIAIGLGAGLIAFSIFWVVKNRKKEKETK